MTLGFILELNNWTRYQLLAMIPMPMMRRMREATSSKLLTRREWDSSIKAMWDWNFFQWLQGELKMAVGVASFDCCTASSSNHFGTIGTTMEGESNVDPFTGDVAYKGGPATDGNSSYS